MRRAPTTDRTTLATTLLLIAIAAAVHFVRAAADPEIRVLFALNGLGFVALGVSAILPLASARRRAVRRLTAGYAALTALLYVMWGATGGEWTLPAGPVALASETALVGLLLWQDRRQGRAGAVRVRGRGEPDPARPRRG